MHCLEKPREAGGTLRKEIHSLKGRQGKQLKPLPLGICNGEEGTEEGGRQDVRPTSGPAAQNQQPGQGDPEPEKVFECTALQPHTKPLLPPDT